jgi:hypothetical protein
VVADRLAVATARVGLTVLVYAMIASQPVGVALPVIREQERREAQDVARPWLVLADRLGQGENLLDVALDIPLAAQERLAERQVAGIEEGRPEYRRRIEGQCPLGRPRPRREDRAVPEPDGETPLPRRDEAIERSTNLVRDPAWPTHQHWIPRLGGVRDLAHLDRHGLASFLPTPPYRAAPAKRDGRRRPPQVDEFPGHRDVWQRAHIGVPRAQFAASPSLRGIVNRLSCGHCFASERGGEHQDRGSGNAAAPGHRRWWRNARHAAPQGMGRTLTLPSGLLSGSQHHSRVMRNLYSIIVYILLPECNISGR